MSDHEPHQPEPSPSSAPESPSSPALFAPRDGERPSASKTPWVVAAVVVLLVLAGVLLTSKAHQGTASAAHVLLPLAPEAATLPITDVAMSEAVSLAGVKSTYIDGVLHNNGSSTLTGATVQVLFANDEQLPPQIETLPVTLIRTRQPYVDTEPIAAEPIPPGGQAEFRLIFEGVGANWNQQIPAIHIIKVTTK